MLAARGSVYKVELTAAQAAHMRDAAVKDLYARLFAWLVGQANDSFVLGQAAALFRTTGGSGDDSDKGGLASLCHRQSLMSAWELSILTFMVLKSPSVPALHQLL